MAKKPGVGYGQPPKATQFKPGKSGNPKGRPKGSLNFSSEFRRELARPVTVRENGQAKKVSKRVALIKTLIAKGLGGDVKAIGATLQLHAQMETEAPMTAPDAIGADEMRILRRFKPRAIQEAAARKRKP